MDVAKRRGSKRAKVALARKILINGQIAPPWAIKVFHCFHQDNDGSKCEVAHTSPPIPRSNVQYSNFDLHGQGGSNATRSHVRYRRARRGGDRIWPELRY